MGKNPKAILKSFDNPLYAQPFSNVAGSSTNLMNFCVLGTDLYNRVGRKIYMKSLHIKGGLKNSAASAKGGGLRAILVYDSQPNAALPLLTTLLKDATGPAATTWNSEINLDQRERFKVLKECLWIVDDTGGAGLGENSLQGIHSLDHSSAIVDSRLGYIRWCG